MVDETPLITTDDIITNAGIKGIDITSYDETALQFEIDKAQGYLETETGRIFNPQTKTDSAFNQTSTAYLFRYYPILDIEEIKINDEVVDESNYRVDYQNGIIYFENEFILTYSGRWLSPTTYTTAYDLKITYIAGYSPALPIAQGIVIDLILYTIKNANIQVGGKIQSMSEKNLSISYDTAQSDINDMDSRIKKLRKFRVVMI